MSHLSADALLATAPRDTSVSIGWPPSAAPRSAQAWLRDVGAVTFVAALIAIGAALPFCG
jgi:hypothetical protein